MHNGSDIVFFYKWEGNFNLLVRGGEDFDQEVDIWISMFLNIKQ